jgi:hypothetical protein
MTGRKEMKMYYKHGDHIISWPREANKNGYQCPVCGEPLGGWDLNPEHGFLNIPEPNDIIYLLLQDPSREGGEACVTLSHPQAMALAEKGFTLASFARGYSFMIVYTYEMVEWLGLELTPRQRRACGA